MAVQSRRTFISSASCRWGARIGKAGSLLKRLEPVPITLREFWASLPQANWNENAKTHDRDANGVKIGLCVSGGADSMCLAYLFEQVHEQNLSAPLDLTAFIVDHKARHESTPEAHSVARLLYQLGIKSEILTMHWPANVSPRTLPNFETQARLKRYRLLAQAALRSGIRHLFLGHHEDDQVETILMRLVRGKSGSMASFRGIAAEAPIPTDSDTARELLSATALTYQKFWPHSSGRPRLHGLVDDPDSDLSASKSVQSLHGRISIAPALDLSLHRPLLKFSKARILATCKANNISFVSDRTNFDPQLTLRNAVRYLLGNHRLPRALRSDSLLQTHDRASDRLNGVSREVNRLFDVAQITSLDLRSGCLTLRLPKLSDLLEWQHLETPVLFLAHILRLVSPIDNYEMSRHSLQCAASVIFSDVSSVQHSSRAAASITTLLASQVLMTRDVRGHSPEQPCYVSWRLSRQPFKREQMQGVSRMFVHQPNAEEGPGTEFWSEWILWDYRYWIRICCASASYLHTCTIRPFQPSDGVDLRTSLDRDSRETLAALLHDTAPGKVRYTLPVVIDDAGVRAFPTLDFAVPKPGTTHISSMKGKAMLLSWQVKYKHIDRQTVERLVGHGSSTNHYPPAVPRDVQHQF